MRTKDIIAYGIKKRKLSQSKIAESIGMSKQAFNLKLQNNTFNTRELCNSIGDTLGFKLLIQYDDGETFQVTDELTEKELAKLKISTMKKQGIVEDKVRVYDVLRDEEALKEIIEKEVELVVEEDFDDFDDDSFDDFDDTLL